MVTNSLKNHHVHIAFGLDFNSIKIFKNLETFIVLGSRFPKINLNDFPKLKLFSNNFSSFMAEILNKKNELKRTNLLSTENSEQIIDYENLKGDYNSLNFLYENRFKLFFKFMHLLD